MARKNKRVEVETTGQQDMFGWLNRGYQLEGLNSWGNFLAVKSNGAVAVLATNDQTGELFTVTSWNSSREAAISEFEQTNETFYL